MDSEQPTQQLDLLSGRPKPPSLELPLKTTLEVASLVATTVRFAPSFARLFKRKFEQTPFGFFLISLQLPPAPLVPLQPLHLELPRRIQEEACSERVHPPVGSDRPPPLDSVNLPLREDCLELPRRTHLVQLLVRFLLYLQQRSLGNSNEGLVFIFHRDSFSAANIVQGEVPANGTSAPAWVQVQDQDPNTGVKNNDYYQTITAMPEYKFASLEVGPILVPFSCSSVKLTLGGRLGLKSWTGTSIEGLRAKPKDCSTATPVRLWSSCFHRFWRIRSRPSCHRRTLRECQQRCVLSFRRP